MSMNSVLYFLIVCLLTIVRISSEDDGETKNPCVVKKIPEAILTKIYQASKKILKGEPPPIDYSDQLQEVKEKLLSLNETFFEVDDETQSKSRTSDIILKYQKRFADTLETVLDANRDVHRALDDVLAEGNKTAELIREQTIESAASKAVLTNITILLEEISTGLSNVTANKNGEGDGDGDISEEILEIEKETNSLVKRMVESSENEKFLRSEIIDMKLRIKSMTLENEKMRSFLKAKENTRPNDCHELFMSGRTKSGVYQIYPNSCDCGPPIRVWCDMTTDGGGWTVLINRGTSDRAVQNFTQPWREYERGFGDPQAEYWIGTSALHALTSNKKYALRLEVKARSRKTKWGRWDTFNVAGPNDKYRLKIGDFSLLSTIGGNVFRKHNNQFFSTFDHDNDASLNRNCANTYKGGWWYGRCYDINPTGILGAADKRTAVSTALFRIGKKSLVQLKKLQLKIKPSTCLGRNMMQTHQTCTDNQVYNFLH